MKIKKNNTAKRNFVHEKLVFVWRTKSSICKIHDTYSRRSWNALTFNIKFVMVLLFKIIGQKN